MISRKRMIYDSGMYFDLPYIFSSRPYFRAPTEHGKVASLKYTAILNNSVLINYYLFDTELK